MTAENQITKLLKLSLSEDVGGGDLTSLATISENSRCTARIIAKQSGVLSGIDITRQVFELADPQFTISAGTDDGKTVAEDEVILKIRGNTASVLVAERTALNFLGHLSGIATLTAAYVKRIKDLPVRITDTRKTTPLWRNLEKKAVRDGGGFNHRLGLYDMILLKENHIRAAGGIFEAVDNCRQYLKQHRLKRKIEVETTNLSEVRQAIDCAVDRIMLDNMKTTLIKKAVQLIDRRAEVEASGGITLKSIRQIAETGVDFISIGALTHSAPALDISLLIEKEYHG